MIEIRIQMSDIRDYADIAALFSDVLQRHCQKMIKDDIIERLRQADEIRQEAGRKYFDLEAAFVPENWDDLTTDEKVLEHDERQKRLDKTKESTAFEDAEEAFITLCEDLILFDRDDHHINFDTMHRKRDLREYLTYLKADEILGQNLFYPLKEKKKAISDKRKEALLMTDFALNDFADELLTYKGLNSFEKELVIVRYNYVLIISLKDIDELRDALRLVIASKKMSTRRKIKCIRDAIEDRTRPLSDWIRNFAADSGFGLQYEAESVAESISRSKYLKRRNPPKVERDKRRVC